MRTHVHLRLLEELFTSYTYPEPFSRHIKKFFRNNKSCGSRDRRQIREAAFCYLRLGKTLSDFNFQKRLLTGCFLILKEAVPLVNDHLEELTGIKPAEITNPLSEKVQRIKEISESFSLNAIFPEFEKISKEVNTDQFIDAQFKRPLVYIRVIGEDEVVKRSLTQQSIDFTEWEPGLLSFEPETPLQNLTFPRDGKFLVMDRSSVEALNKVDVNKKERWWDCCAGAGGKSLLFKYRNPEAELWCSDIRKGILKNLLQRARETNLNLDKVLHEDLSEPVKPGKIPKFDGILFDAPCSGSGTWARDPEHLMHFPEGKIEHYTALQKKIGGNVLPFLKPGGTLIYITCSVYEAENELMVQELVNRHSLELISQQYIRGYEHRANTLFIAVLRK